MRVFVVVDAHGAVGEHAVHFDACRVAAAVVVPACRTGDVGQRHAVLAVGVQLGAVVEHQVLARRNRACRIEQGDAQFAGGRTGICAGVVSALGQGSAAEPDTGDL